MNGNDVLQIAVYLAVLLVCVKPLGAYMANVYEGRTNWAREQWLFRLTGVDANASMTWRGYAGAFLLFNALGTLAVYALLRLQHLLPWNPQGFAGRRAAYRVQYRCELRHQHELAKLWRRDDAELFHPDGGPHCSELRLSRFRHGRSGCAGAWTGVAQHRQDRQLLGGYGSEHALHSAAAVGAVGDPAGVAGRDPEPRPLRAGRRIEAGDSHGAGCLADRHQATGDQRRRVLQRQLRPPVREPHAALELCADAGDPADSGGAMLHVRPHGQRPAARLGATRGHD